MNFSHSQPIFIQIVNLICRRALDGTYQPDNRIPSVRELAVEVEVNPNTVMRSFERLQNEGIIYMKRGLGYYISPDAPQKILEQRRTAFLQEELPQLFSEMKLLGIDFDAISRAYSVYLENESNRK